MKEKINISLNDKEKIANACHSCKNCNCINNSLTAERNEFRKKIKTKMQNLQDRICESLEALDGTTHFKEDKWERNGGGGGRTRVIEGDHIEKGGVNYSAVHGDLSPTAMKALNVADPHFFATGVSIVLHPSNPHVPIIHMNVRYFETSEKDWWFGGGIDLTPHYVMPEEAKAFHQKLKAVCDVHNPGFYQEFKTWADEYFYLTHRKESRGIGGIFFDKLGSDRFTKEQGLQFILDVGNTFIPAYAYHFQKNFNLPYTELEKEWQLVRRGRYAEFNLIIDRGTKFGLETHGRTESILMSLPKEVRWYYNYPITNNSNEAATLQFLKMPQEWI
jgi:coproporphyrinogen III oxidase